MSLISFGFLEATCSINLRLGVFNALSFDCTHPYFDRLAGLF